MDADRFDDFARVLSESASRRVLLGAAAGLILARSSVFDLAAKRKRRRHRRRPKCRSSNCDGCCTNQKQCIPASIQDEFACGLNGEPCQPCSDGLECIRGKGVCECTTNSCVGCCTPDLTECEAGNEDSACGENADFCQNCSIQGLICGARQECCTACGVGCCVGGEKCVLPWNGAPQDQHCCAIEHDCPGSQTGCCGAGLACTPRINPPAGTPTHACVT